MEYNDISLFWYFKMMFLSGTEQWVAASVTLNTTTDNKVSYGLFAGSYSRTVSTEEVYRLEITCNFGKNKCALLCGPFFYIRWNFLEMLLDSNVTTDGYTPCNSIRSLGSLSRDVGMSLTPQSRADDVARSGFINSGLWLSTVLFLIISCLFGITSTTLAIWNAVSNPVETFFSTLGLFIYTCLACVCMLIAIILWAIQFSVTLRNNIAIYDTIASAGSNDPATLGYSYWLIIVAFVGYGCSAAILIVRYILINKEPDSIVNIEDKNDNTIILF